MTEDARFEDGGEAPLRLRAVDAEDLAVVSGLAQDAVLTGADISWRPRERRLALLLNRVRWEDQHQPPERVRAVVVIENVLSVQAQGLDARDSEVVLSLLSVSFEPGDAPSGRVVLTFAGDGALGADVEALEVVLRDVTRPYRAVSGRVPDHDA